MEQERKGRPPVSKAGHQVFQDWERLKRQLRPLPPEHLARWREHFDNDMRELGRQQRRERGGQ